MSEAPLHAKASSSAPRVLGDLLGPEAQAPVSEKDWVGLIESIATGDPRALYVLYARTHRLVFTLIMRITNDRGTAEALTLEVFNDVWGRASTYDAAGGSVVGWIMNQARSRAIDRLPREPRRKPVNRDAHGSRPATASGDAADALPLGEQAALLRDALTVLTPAERQAIETAFFSELTYQEVAARLEQPPGIIKTRVRSGLRKLCQALVKTVTAR